MSFLFFKWLKDYIESYTCTWWQWWQCITKLWDTTYLVTTFTFQNIVKKSEHLSKNRSADLHSDDDTIRSSICKMWFSFLNFLKTLKSSCLHFPYICTSHCNEKKTMKNKLRAKGHQRTTFHRITGECHYQDIIIIYLNLLILLSLLIIVIFIPTKLRHLNQAERQYPLIKGNGKIKNKFANEAKIGKQ